MTTFSGSEWKKSDILKAWNIISGIAKEKYQLDWYEPQFEIVNEEGMIHCHSCIGMPTMLDHWSYGKHYINLKKDFRDNKTGLALELIINSNPSICYLLESNNLTEMIEVIAHAAVGHSSHFKNGGCFKRWTNAETILPFLIHFKNYLQECENQYGVKEVEHLLDVVTSVSNISYDKYKKQSAKTQKELDSLRKQRIVDDEKHYNALFDSLRRLFKEEENIRIKEVKPNLDSSDNFLRMLVKHGDLPEWKNNIIMMYIVLNQYFYPQMQCKMIAEGWATFWQNKLRQDLYAAGHITEGMVLEGFKLNANVTPQQIFSHIVRDQKLHNKYYSGVNPYFLGLNIFEEIERVCNEQDEESLRFVPCLRGMHWLEGVKYALEHFEDSTFIHQFLTPKLLRKLRVGVVERMDVIGKRNIRNGLPFNHSRMGYVLSKDHDDSTFEEVRELFARSYDLSHKIPTITTYVNLGSSQSDRIVPELFLVYTPLYGQGLYQPYLKKVVKYIESLWRGKVVFTPKESFRLLEK